MRQVSWLAGIGLIAAALAACGDGDGDGDVSEAGLAAASTSTMSDQERDFLHAINGVGWPVEANDEAVSLAGSVCEAFEQGNSPSELAVLMGGLANRADSYTIMAIMAEHYCPDVPQVADLPPAAATSSAVPTS